MFAELKFKIRCYLNRNKDMELHCPQCLDYFSGDYMGYTDAGGCFQPEDLANQSSSLLTVHDVLGLLIRPPFRNLNLLRF